MTEPKGLKWETSRDDGAWRENMAAFRAALEDYEPPALRWVESQPPYGPTVQPPCPADATPLERLRWLAAMHSIDHPELEWRVWVHPQIPDKFWLKIGGSQSSVSRDEAVLIMRASDDAIRAYKTRWL
jgi:hypothetical protein